MVDVEGEPADREEDNDQDQHTDGSSTRCQPTDLVSDECERSKACEKVALSDRWAFLVIGFCLWFPGLAPVVALKDIFVVVKF